jgi:hypothetical protein
MTSHDHQGALVAARAVPANSRSSATIRSTCSASRDFLTRGQEAHGRALMPEILAMVCTQVISGARARPNAANTLSILKSTMIS